MKRFFLLTAILAVFGLSSCQKDPANAIVGKWEAVSMEATIAGVNMTVDMADTGMTMEFTFNDDGSGSLYFGSEYGDSESQAFTYSVKGNMLYVTADDETEGIPISIDNDTMTIEMDGELIGEENSKVKIHFKKVK